LRIYFDSCVVIYGVEQPAGDGASVLDAISCGNPSDEYVVSDLVRLECLVKPVRAGNQKAVAAIEDAIAGIAILPWNRDVFDKALDLRARLKFKTPGALHIAAALAHGCTEIWTNDARFQNVADLLTVRRFPQPPTSASP